MATNIKIIPANDLIKAMAEGELDFEGSKRLVKLSKGNNGSDNSG